MEEEVRGISARHWMVVWRRRGGKGMLVPGIGWLCGGEVRGC